ncbi:transposase-like protein [Klebsiella variicola]|nr:transposase-like protein [Klebsiella variicola]
MSQPNQHCIGIDVAKLSLNIAGTKEFSPFSASNDEDGFMSILNVLEEWKI